jgi:hypothetical protein
MSGPSTATKQVTSINGTVIVAREPAIGPHPRWPDRQVARTGIERVLLEDGAEIMMCSECGWTHSDVTSVVSHRNGAHIRKTHQRYPEATLRALIREVQRAKRAGHRGFAMRAAEALNALGLKTASGNEWDQHLVSHVYNQYKDKYRVRTPQARTEGGRLNGRPTPASDGSLTVRQEIDTLHVLLASAVEALARLSVKVDQPQVDPVLVEKAKKWDDFQELMGRRSGS